MSTIAQVNKRLIRWSRFARPSWWVFQWKRQNFARFWWRYLRSHPFREDIGSVDELVQFGRKHNVLGFNRECIRSYIFWKLHQHFQCTSFVETGTFYGYTSAYVRQAFKTPVFTSEINPTYYLVSKANLLWVRGIKKFRTSSPVFLENVCRPSLIGDNPMFYLDAHWYDYMPLPDELATIRDRSERGIILIDDFLVPAQPQFIYDEYEGIPIDLNVVKSALDICRDGVSVYLPNYHPEREPTGLGIGFAIILMGQEHALPETTFPFDLLTKVDL